jgi:hypothetical protein
LFFAARAALAAELPEQARRWADAAIRLFRAQQRQSWESRALLLATQSRYVCGDRSARLLARIVDLAPQLAELHAEEAPLAYLLAGRLALECRRPELAIENLMAATAYRHNGPPLTRATGWLAVAMQAGSADRQRGLLLACRRGLDALDEHRFIFGAAEIRAMATSHGRDLAALAIDAVARKGSPRSMLEWAERWRATSLAEPSVRATNDSELEPELAALRDAARRLEEVGEAGTRSALLQEQRLRREAVIRRRRLQISGSLGPPPGFDVDELLSSLGPARLVVLIEANGVLNALVAGGGQVRRHEVGPVAAATHEVAFARFALRRAAHARDARTAAIAEPLQRVLLGPVARLIDDEPVVVVPPARLHLAPWALLPALAGRPVSVAPSALMWLRARTTAARPPDEHRVSLIVGPQLGTAGAEVTSLAALYPSATVLGAESSANCSATIDAVLDSISGAWIAHIAAHGVFRADSPLFSSLKLDEGPLFVHDVDRLPRPPHRVVLSACDTGVAAPVGADELLGMVSALLRIGAAGVLASVVPVNDVAVVPFMVAVHSALANGKDMPEAALEGRQVASSEPQAAAAAASFNVWGS